MDLGHEQTWRSAAQSKTGAASVIDVVRRVYYKILGQEKLLEQPVIAKAKFSSRRAEEEIKGVCLCVEGSGGLCPGSLMAVH